MVDKKTQRIICTVHGVGREHDFKIFKRSGVHLKQETKCLGDKGYQGLQKRHGNSQTPQKKKRKSPLTKEEKKHNRELASQRVVVEHVIRKLKVWRILGERYRNRRRRHGLRVNLISGILNHELEQGERVEC